MGDENTTEEYGRPRRPNPETVSYLRGLPLEETLAAEQARNYIQYFQTEKKGDDKTKEHNDDPPEYPALVSATHAALSSIYKELASLSCEENSSTQIETLVRIACRYSNVAKRVVLAGMSGYWVFLSSHRFGSHVAQTVLRCVVASCEADLDILGCDIEGGEGEGKMIIEESYGILLQSGNGGDEVPSLKSLLLQTLEELKPYAADLAVHVCGTHVLRTSLCILAGVEFVDAYAPAAGAKNTQTNTIVTEWDNGPLASTRRGKFKDKKKKKKKKPASGGGDEDRGSSRQEVTVMKPFNMTSDLRSEEFRNESNSLLRDMVDIISLAEGQQLQRGIKNKTNKVQPPGELQQRSCHPSAGPLLVQMLRLLSFRDNDSNFGKKGHFSCNDASADRKLGILPPEPRYSSGSEAETLVYRLLCWDPNIAVGNDDDESREAELNENNAAKQPYASDIIYGLSGEPRGSILLETIFHCCPDSFHDMLCKIGGFYDEATMKEYVSHGVSNFVVQTLLVSARDKNQTSKLVKCLCGILEDGSILNAKHRNLDKMKNDNDEEPSSHGKNQRMGIIWRAFEMCASKGSTQDQEQLIHALMRGYASTASMDSNDDKEGSKRKKRSKAKGLSVEGCIPLLLGLTPSKPDDVQEYSSADRLTIDAAGARALYHIFHFTQRLRSEWVNGFVKLYCQSDLVKIANDGLASRW